MRFKLDKKIWLCLTCGASVNQEEIKADEVMSAQ